MFVAPENYIVFNKGDISDAFYIVLHGEVEVLTVFPDGSEKVVNTLGMGRAFGERGLIKKAPRSLTVRTTRQTSFIVVKGTLFKKILMKEVNI